MGDMEMLMGLIYSDLRNIYHSINDYIGKEVPLKYKKFRKSSAAYSIQQAAEKMVKIQIYYSGKEYSNNKMYNHNLSFLITYAESIGVKLYIPDYIRKNGVSLTNWESKGRYDIHLQVKIDTMQRYYEVLVAWFEELKKMGYL